MSYTYNGQGLRSGKTVNGTTQKHIWDGQNIVLELRGSTVVSKYIRGINLIYSQLEGNTEKVYYLYNGHGDVVQLTNGSEAVTKSYAYDAFGNEKNPDANDVNVFRYSGEYFDKETGTIYLRARYYDKTIGRFLAEDTTRARLMNIYESYGYYQGVQLNGGVYVDWTKRRYIVNDPLSINLYTHCQNNPLRYTDPDGHIPLLAITAIGGAVIGGVWGGISAAKSGGLWWQGALKGVAIGGVAGLTLGAAGSLVASTAMGGASLTLTATQTFSGFSALVQGGAAATLWGASRDGVNQGMRHFFEYANQYPGRLADIAKNLGVKSFELT